MSVVTGSKSCGSETPHESAPGNFWRGPILLAACLLAASWPVLRWFFARLGDGGDERFGLVALALAVALTPRTLWRQPVALLRIISASLLVIASALPIAMPMLVRALCVVAALSVLLGSGAGAVGRAGLMALSLPLTATLQFFAGYPLRVMTAELGRPLIALFGITTERAGVALKWTGGQVVVDAPCSGVHMLWTGGVLVCALAAWLRLSAWRTVALGVAGLAGILLGNIVRAAILFFIESGLWRAPHWAHEGVGLVIFAALAAGVLWLGIKLKNEGRVKPPAEPKNVNNASRSRLSRRLRPTIVVGIFASLCVVAAAMPILNVRTQSAATTRPFPGWPETFEGKPWIRLSRPANAAAFAAGFSGETGVFKQRQGGAERLVILRWIREASRGVHPAADCFRASGYDIKTGGLVRDADGVMWSVFSATREGESWRVRERWHDEHDGAWTDVSAWYWSAVRADESGPWWAVTIAEPVEE